MTITEAFDLMVSLYVKGLIRNVTICDDTLSVDCWFGARFTAGNVDELIADVQREIDMYARGEE
jgi:hypothetical protein